LSVMLQVMLSKSLGVFLGNAAPESSGWRYGGSR